MSHLIWFDGLRARTHPMVCVLQPLNLAQRSFACCFCYCCRYCRLQHIAYLLLSIDGKSNVPGSRDGASSLRKIPSTVFFARFQTTPGNPNPRDIPQIVTRRCVLWFWFLVLRLVEGFVLICARGLLSGLSTCRRPSV